MQVLMSFWIIPSTNVEHCEKYCLLEPHYLAIKAPKQLVYNTLQLDMEI
jgi:hypothetical protein